MTVSPRQSGKLAARERHAPTSGLLRGIEPFFAVGEVSGGPLLVATLIALALANSPWHAGFATIWSTPLSLHYGSWRVGHSLAEWISDALMPLFFLIIGTEVKREFVKGSLSSMRTAAFPVAGAIGGLVVPVGIFLALNPASDTHHGWGIVAAMDTAFSLAIVAMFATRLPVAVRAVLLAFAAIDDVFGLLVIAFAYTGTLDPWPLALAGAGYAAILGLQGMRWASTPAYVLCGVAVWAGVFGSGVHPTIAGVALGLLLPVRSRLSGHGFSEQVEVPIAQLRDAQDAARDADAQDDEEAASEQRDRAEHKLGFIHEMAAATDEPADRLVRTLTPWVSYLVLPLFALSHVQVHFSPGMASEALRSPLALGIVAGLTLGKPLGFLAGSGLATWSGAARLPQDIGWRMVLGIGAVAGIGFTLSLFIAELALSDPRQIETASFAILVASLLSGIAGFLILWSAAGRATADEPADRGWRTGGG